MNNKVDKQLHLFKGYSAIFLSIAFGIFLFVLFFQPFQLDGLDFNNRLIFVAGLGAIVFLLMILIRIVLYSLFQIGTINKHSFVLSPFVGGLSLLVLSSVAFAFYLRYVGKVYISFFVMAKIILITAVAPVVLRLYDIIVTLRHQNEALVRERKVIQKKVEKYEDDYLNKSIEFISENGTETYSLTIADVIFIRSADNYVEIIHQETGTIRKKLIRNTLKNIERQIKPYSNFIRCHRICIVNMHYIEKLNKSYNTHWVSLKKTDEKIPVSRQYLLKLKDIV